MVRAELANRIRMEEISWKQKAREKWIEEGDRNTRYFHSLASHRRRCNPVEKLQIVNKFVSGNDYLREGAMNFFQQLYIEEFLLQPTLDELHFNQISEASRCFLEEEFTDEEILDSLRSCNRDKVPGPDGFNIKFIQEFWLLLKTDLVKMFREFHQAGSFVKSLNSTFIVLIPKMEGANDIKQFRPISLVGCIYKLISKVLTKRLSKVLKEVIGENRHAFVKDRQIECGSGE